MDSLSAGVLGNEGGMYCFGMVLYFLYVSLQSDCSGESGDNC